MNEWNQSTDGKENIQTITLNIEYLFSPLSRADILYISIQVWVRRKLPKLKRPMGGD